MELDFGSASQWLLGPEPIDQKHPGHLWPRWIFLRCLGLIYFSAFYSLLFQIRGLIGPDGILPAADYFLVRRTRPRDNDRLLAGSSRLAPGHPEYMAASLAVSLLHMFSLFRLRRPGFLQLSIRRHAPGSRLHRTLLRASRISSRPRTCQSALSR